MCHNIKTKFYTGNPFLIKSISVLEVCEKLFLLENTIHYKSVISI